MAASFGLPPHPNAVPSKWSIGFNFSLSPKSPSELVLVAASTLIASRTVLSEVASHSGIVNDPILDCLISTLFCKAVAFFISLGSLAFMNVRIITNT